MENTIDTNDIERLQELQSEIEGILGNLDNEIKKQEQSLQDKIQSFTKVEDIDVNKLKKFADNPYKIIPRGENEYYVVAPRFIPFHVGHLMEQDEAWNVFVINKYVSWIEDVPEEIREKIDLDSKYEDAVVDRSDGLLEALDEEQRELLWDDLGGRDGGLHKRVGDKKIQIQKGEEFEVISQLVEEGTLPFKPEPIDKTTLRDEPLDVSLRPYQQRAWEEFMNHGHIGVFWPPGLGKTFFALYAGERVSGEKLVVVPSTMLEEQWNRRIEENTEHPNEWIVKTYQYLSRRNNIDEFTGKNSPELAVYDECLSGDVEIETESGRVPFSKLDDSIDLECGWNAVQDMKVKSYNSEDGNYFWDDINRVYKDKKTITEIKLRNGEVFEATDNHTHIMVDGETLEIKESSDIDVGDYLVKPHSGKQNRDEEYGLRLENIPNLSLLQIESIEEQDEKQDVYDLETQSHRFIADGILTHNCHTLPANTFSKIAAVESTYRIGLSATPYREDDRTDYVFSLTGQPVGIEWQELQKYGDFSYPNISVYLYRTQRQKRLDLNELIDDPGKTLVFCDSLDDGNRLSEAYDIPFISGETKSDERMDIIRNNRVVIASRVADEGISLDEIDRVIEYDFHGKSRRQELQRVGRLMHTDDTVGSHIVQMTDDEYEKFGERLYSLEEKGMEIEFIRRR